MKNRQTKTSGPDCIAELKGLGPKSRDMLARAGITSPEQLRALGSVRAYVQVKRTDGKASLNLLWALESALSGEPWQDVARLHRTSLLLALDQAGEASGNPPAAKASNAWMMK